MSKGSFIMALILLIWAASVSAQPAPSPTGSTGYTTIQDEGSSLPRQHLMNFTGTGVACSNNAGNSATDCSITTTTPSTPPSLYVAGHTYPAELALAADTEATPYWMTGGNCKISGCIGLTGGSGEYFRVLGQDALSSAESKISFDGWVYSTDVTASHDQYILQKGSISGGTIAFSIAMNTLDAGRINVDFSNAGGTISYYSAPLTINTWYHVAVVYDDTIACGSGKVKIYVNGADSTTQVACHAGATQAVTNNEIHIGADYAGAHGWKGRLDEWRIWENKALSSGEVGAEYNSGSGRACTASDSGLSYCWHFDDGDNDGTTTTIAAQVIIPASAGDDANAGTSSGAPLLTLQAALDKWPKFFGSNGTIYVASGTVIDSAELLGVSNNGEYTLKIVGYINATPNSFSNSESLSGTSSGSNTNDFPLNAGTLFNDTTASQFGSAGSLDGYWLELTGGTGYDASDPDNNWYVIDTNTSSSQLKIVGNWKVLQPDETPVQPDNTTTYNIYNPWFLSTIHGSRLHDYALHISSSRGGIQLSQLRFTGGRMAGLFVTSSQLDYGHHNVWTEYFPDHDLTRLVAYNNGPMIGNGFLVGAGSHIGNFDTSIALDNRSIGFYINEHSSAESLNHDLARGQIDDSGFACAMMCNVRDWRQNQADYNGWAGWSVTIGGYTYRFTENRASANYWAGLSVSDSASVAFYKGGSRYDPNLTYRHGSVFDSNIGSGIKVFRGASLNIAGGGTMGSGDIVSTNNGGYGGEVFGASCVTCTGILYTVSGNASGPWSIDALSAMISPLPIANGNLALSDVWDNNTTKNGRLVLRHYTNSEEPVALVYGYSNSTDNYVKLGGGSSTLNASTNIDFYTAANNTTLTGTLRMRVGSNGHLIFQANPPTASSCGSSPTLTSPSNDTDGVVVVGTGTITSCTITFIASFTGSPICTLTTDHDNRLWISSWSSTAITISSANNMAGKKIFYHCLGRTS